MDQRAVDMASRLRLWILLALLLWPEEAQSSCSITTLSSGLLAVCHNISLSGLKANPSSFIGGGQPSAIKELAITGTLGSSIEADTFSAFTSISRITITATITRIESSAFSGLPSLNYLLIKESRLESISFEVFRGFQGDNSNLQLILENNTPLSLNKNLEQFVVSLSDVTIISLVHCDCHIIWLKNILGTSSYFYNPGDINCFSSLPHLNGTDLNFADVSDLNSSCPDICDTTLNECGENANCISISTDVLNCSCHPGFEGDGFTCSNVNECLSVSCPTGKTCLDTIGNYTCVPIICEENEVLLGNTCECAGVLVRNETSDNCECPGGTTYTEDNCTCDDSLSTFNSSSGTCDCIEGSFFNSSASVCQCENTRSLNGSECTCKDGLVEDMSSKLCVCPSGTIFSEDTGLCTCEFSDQIYNSSLEACVCTGNRTFNGTNCICTANLIEDTFGECVCPRGLLYSSSTSNCTCEFSDQIYNPSLEVCVCTGNMTFNGTNCICTANLIEDSLGECVCPSRLLYSSSTSNCTCEFSDQIYNPSLEVCVCTGNRTFNGTNCICTANLIEDSLGECVCPSELLYSSSTSNCTCEFSDQIYNPSLEVCVCTGNRTFNGTNCICTANLIEDSLGECVCPRGLLYSSSTSNCTCEFSDQIYDPSLEVCVCTDNMTFNGTNCVCTANLIEDSLGECVCPSKLLYSSSTSNCTCESSDQIYNPSLEVCVCTGNRTFNGTNCICTANLIEDSLGECVCPSELLYSSSTSNCTCEFSDQIYNPSLEVCVCTGNRTFNGTNCICTANLIEDSLGECVCPSRLLYSSSTSNCTCEFSDQIYNPSLEVCVCTGNMTFNGTNCICTANLIEDSLGECVCPSGLLYSSSTSNCTCEFSDQIYNPSLEVCVCTGNRTFNGTNCICTANLIEDSLGECVCPRGLLYSSSTSNCTCEFSDQIYNPSLETCVCTGNMTLNGTNCVCIANLIEDEDDSCICPSNLIYSFLTDKCSCFEHSNYNRTLEECQCIAPYEMNITSGLCNCIGDCPSIFTDLLNELKANPSVATINAVVMETTSAIHSDEFTSNDTENLVNLIEESTTLLGVFNATPEEVESITMDVLNVIDFLLDEDSVEFWSEVSDVQGTLGDVVTTVENIAEALSSLALQSDSGTVVIKTNSTELRIISVGVANDTQWQNFVTSSGSLNLPENIGQLSNSSIIVSVGVIEGANRLLPNYSNFEAPDQPRILSGLCPSREPTISQESTLNSVIIIISVYSDSQIDTSSLDPPVRIAFNHQSPNFQSPHCVSASTGSGINWMDIGCRVVFSNESTTECECTHLTSFSILVHPSTNENPPLALMIATKIGLCISILCLLAAIIILFAVKVKSDLPKVHRQLALALLLTEVVFLIGVDRNAIPSPDWLCTMFAVILHYCLLTTFTWMLLEGVHIFLFLVIVFFSDKVYKVYTLLGWTIPIPIVAISLGTRFCYYGSSRHCWISDDVTLWAVRVPLIVVMFVNSIVLIAAIVIIFREKRKREQNLRAIKDALWTAGILLPVLGLCWLLGLFIFGEDVYRQIVEWLFFGVVILQGILIFFLHCIVNKEVRTAILKKLGVEKHKLKSEQKYTGSAFNTLKSTVRKFSSSTLLISTSRKVSEATDIELHVKDAL